MTTTELLLQPQPTTRRGQIEAFVASQTEENLRAYTSDALMEMDRLRRGQDATGEKLRKAERLVKLTVDNAARVATICAGLGVAVGAGMALAITALV